jgi:hypothetical protein
LIASSTSCGRSQAALPHISHTASLICSKVMIFIYINPEFIAMEARAPKIIKIRMAGISHGIFSKNLFFFCVLIPHDAFFACVFSALTTVETMLFAAGVCGKSRE